MSDERRAAYFHVSYETIEQLLQLPLGHKIKRISNAFNGFDDSIVVIAEGPDLPVVELGVRLSNVCPKYEKNEDGTISFIGWE